VDGGALVPAIVGADASGAGVVGGVWHQRRSGRKLAITVEPVRELTATHRRQLDDEVDLVGAVMQATPTLTMGTVTVGPHA
jgi:hypothetical protein